MNAGRGVGRAGAARNETNARPSGRLPDGFRHHCGPTLLTAHRHLEVAIVKSVEHGEIALAGNAEHVPHAIGDQLVDQRLGGGSGVITRAHADVPGYWKFFSA